MLTHLLFQKNDNTMYSDVDNFPDYNGGYGTAYSNSFDDVYDRDDRDDHRSAEDSNAGNPENCRADGLVTSYEKVTDFTYDIGRKDQIPVGDDIGIVTNCLEICSNDGKDCLSMTLLNERGGRQRCFSHTGSAGVDGTNIVAATGVTYFEKICIRGNILKYVYLTTLETKLGRLILMFVKYVLHCCFDFTERSCRRGWSFTRVPRFEYIGDANEEINDVKSINDCRSLCLAATLYECRSATYDSNARICRLTEETKRSAPSEFRPADFGIDYLENECAEG